MMVAAGLEPERLVFVDECGTHTSLAPIYGYAPKGERLRLSVPRKRGKNTTLLSSMSLEGMGPSLTVEGATTAVVFEAYVEQVLAPSLHKGQRDSGHGHHGQPGRPPTKEGRGANRVAGMRAPLSAGQLPRVPHRRSLQQDQEPDLLRKAAARSKEALVEAIGAALSAVTASDAWGFFEHAGYHPVSQLR